MMEIEKIRDVKYLSALEPASPTCSVATGVRGLALERPHSAGAAAYCSFHKLFELLELDPQSSRSWLNPPGLQIISAKKLMIPMRDGVRLATDIYFPGETGRLLPASCR